MVSSRSWKNSNFCRMMSLALCLGVAFCLLTGSAMAAGTTKLATFATPSTYASELTLTPATALPPTLNGNTYKLVNSASFNSDIYRAMNVARTTAQNFTVVVTLNNGARFATGVLPVGADVTVDSISGTPPGAGAATFTVAAGGANNGTSVTFLSNIGTSFTGFPTLKIAAGASGWTIKDVNNQLATGPITVTVQTFDAADGSALDTGGTDTVDIARAAPAVIIPTVAFVSTFKATTAVVDVGTNRQNFVPNAPDTTTVDNGATLAIGYATPAPLNLAGTAFALAATDTVTLTFTSSNDFTGLTAIPFGATTGIQWNAISATTPATAPTTRVIALAGTAASIGAGTQNFVFTVTGTTVLPTRVISVAVDLALAVGGSTNGGARNLLAVSPVTTWTFNGSVLVANWLSGDSTTFKSRIYLWNPSSTTGAVTARVFSMPLVTSGTQTSTELTTPGSPLSLGSLAGNSSMAIRLFEDILGPAGLNIAPYTTNGGNVVVEITVRASNVRGTCQVFYINGTQQFGQTQLQVVQ